MWVIVNFPTTGYNVLFIYYCQLTARWIQSHNMSTLRDPCLYLGTHSKERERWEKANLGQQHTTRQQLLLWNYPPVNEIFPFSKSLNLVNGYHFNSIVLIQSIVLVIYLLHNKFYDLRNAWERPSKKIQHDEKEKGIFAQWM